MDVDPALQGTIDRAAAAAATFVTGDAGEYTALLSSGDDLTIFGAFGDAVLGHGATVERVRWAAGRFSGGELSYEPLAAGSSGDLGYAVGIERGRVTVAGADGPREMVLRVTQVFRREDGDWRLVHRHADPVASVTTATAVLAGGGDSR